MIRPVSESVLCLLLLSLSFNAQTQTQQLSKLSHNLSFAFNFLPLLYPPHHTLRIHHSPQQRLLTNINLPGSDNQTKIASSRRDQRIYQLDGNCLICFQQQKYKVNY